MNLIHIFIIVLVIGLVVYIINNFLPVDRKFKSFLNLLAVIFLIIWLLKVLLVVTDTNI